MLEKQRKMEDENFMKDNEEDFDYKESVQSFAQNDEDNEYQKQIKEKQNLKKDYLDLCTE